MIYPYVCDSCGRSVELGRLIDERDLPVLCDHGGTVYVQPKDRVMVAGELAIRSINGDTSGSGRLDQMRRAFPRTVGIHFHGIGWTRGPAIMRDPIAAGHQGQRQNWGTTDSYDRFPTYDEIDRSAAEPVHTPTLESALAAGREIIAEEG